MPKEDRDPEVMDAYQPTHRVINVSDPSWKATLAKLYPQATVDKDYLKGLFNSVNDAGHSLYFAIFRHNEGLGRARATSSHTERICPCSTKTFRRS
jgi:hypothetical protein